MRIKWHSTTLAVCHPVRQTGVRKFGSNFSSGTAVNPIRNFDSSAFDLSVPFDRFDTPQLCGSIPLDFISSTGSTERSLLGPISDVLRVSFHLETRSGILVSMRIKHALIVYRC